MGKDNAKIRLDHVFMYRCSKKSGHSGCGDRTGHGPVRILRTIEVMKTTPSRIKRFGLSSLGQFCMILFLMYLILSGCVRNGEVPSALSKIPMLSQNVAQSYSYPMWKVKDAAAHGLNRMGYTIARIEFQRGLTLIEAQKDHITIVLNMESLAQDLTRVGLKITSEYLFTGEVSDREIFDKIAEVLAKGNYPAITQIVAVMTKVYHEPDKKSQTVAYFASGTHVTILDNFDNPDWSRVKLLSGGFGYIPKRNFTPVPFKEEKPRDE